MTKELKEEIDQYISYAVKEGYLDDDEALGMSWEQKKDYYDRGCAIDPIDFIDDLEIDNLTGELYER